MKSDPWEVGRKRSYRAMLSATWVITDLKSISDEVQGKSRRCSPRNLFRCQLHSSHVSVKIALSFRREFSSSLSSRLLLLQIVDTLLTHGKATSTHCQSYHLHAMIRMHVRRRTQPLNCVSASGNTHFASSSARLLAFLLLTGHKRASQKSIFMAKELKAFKGMLTTVTSTLISQALSVSRSNSFSSFRWNFRCETKLFLLIRFVPTSSLQRLQLRTSFSFVGENFGPNWIWKAVH